MTVKRTAPATKAELLAGFDKAEPAEKAHLAMMAAMARPMDPLARRSRPAPSVAAKKRR